MMRKNIIKAACLFSAFLQYAVLADAQTSNLSYSPISDGDITTLKVTGVNKVENGEVVVPEVAAYRGWGYPVTAIGSLAFSSAGFYSIHFPRTLTRIGRDAFGRSYNPYGGGLIEVHIDDLEAWMNVEFENLLANPFYVGAYRLFFGDEEVKDLVIPDGVKEIKPYAFRNCYNLRSITVPGSVKVIGEGAFQNCVNVKTVTLNEGLESIGMSAFEGSRELKSITIPASVTEIGGNPSISDLEEERPQLVFASNANFVVKEDYICSKSGKLVWVKPQEKDSFVVPEEIVEIGSHAFYGCKFRYIELGDNVRSISDCALSGSCYNTLYLGKNIAYVGERALDSNEFVSVWPDVKVISTNPVPPACPETVGYLAAYGVTLYVPTASCDAYLNAPGWCRFKSIVGVDDFSEILAQ